MEPIENILIIDDNEFFCKSKKEILKQAGYQVSYLLEPAAGLTHLQEHNTGLVLLDLQLPGISGIELIPKIKKIAPAITIIMITGQATVGTAVAAMKQGAYDYLSKEIEDEELLLKIDRALERRRHLLKIDNLKQSLTEHFSFSNMVGSHPLMREVYQTVKTVCDTDITVLITGETGTGKELIAKAIHFNGNRRDKPFIVLNCAAISEHLLESELFGHEKGAFTDAHKQKIGKVELAHTGSLFLDEIGDMSFNLQAKLLRFLQDKTFERVGGIDKLSSDVRVIAATNKDLPALIAGGKFREDLYYRINTIHIEIPPLRDRLQDLPLLVEYLIKKSNIRFGKNVTGISESGIKLLKTYSWPGNVRELENLIDHLVLVVQKNIIDHTAVSEHLNPSRSGIIEYEFGNCISLAQAKNGLEKKYLTELLIRTGGDIEKTASQGGLDRKTVLLKMKKHQLKKSDFRTK